MPPIKSAAKKTTAKKVSPQPQKATKATKATRATDPTLPIVPIGTGSGLFVRGMIYGPPGCGKTPLIGTSPKCLIAECDRGDESAARYGSTADKWVINDWDDMQSWFDYLRHQGCKDYEWAWIDSLTLFQDRGLNNIMEELVIEKPHRRVYLPDKGEYGQNMNRVTKLIRDLTDLPMNVGVVCHGTRTIDIEGETLEYPYIQGKDMPQKICAMFGLIAHIEHKVVNGEDHPILVTARDGVHYVKDRYGAIGRLVDPTIPKVMVRIEKARAAART